MTGSADCVYEGLVVGLVAEVTGADVVVECKHQAWMGHHWEYSAVLSASATYKCLGYPFKGVPLFNR